MCACGARAGGSMRWLVCVCVFWIVRVCRPISAFHIQFQGGFAPTECHVLIECSEGEGFDANGKGRCAGGVDSGKGGGENAKLKTATIVYPQNCNDLQVFLMPPGTHARTHTRTHTHTHTNTCSINICMYVCIPSICVCMCFCRTHVFECVCVCVCVCVFISLYTEG